MTRVLMVAATPYFADRGCHVRVQGETRALERRGIDVAISTYGIGRDVPGGTIERCALAPGHDRLDAAPSTSKLLPDLYLLANTVRLAEGRRPDVIHAHTQEGGLVGLLVGRLLDIPVVIDLQSRRVAEELVAYGKSREGGVLFLIADFFDRAVPRRADAVIASTRAIVDFVRENAAPDGPVELVEDAIDLAPASAKRDHELARSLGVDPDRPTIVYLGLLLESQGVDLLLTSFARLRRRRDDVQLLLLGYPDVAVWRARAKELGIEQSVITPGAIPFEEAPSHIALGDLAVSAKRASTEGNGKLLLYMSEACATLALDTETNRQILGVDGLYASDDPDEFATAIDTALGDPEGRERRGAALRRRVARTATWDARAELLEDLYTRIARSGRGSQ